MLDVRVSLHAVGFMSTIAEVLRTLHWYSQFDLF